MIENNVIIGGTWHVASLRLQAREVPLVQPHLKVLDAVSSEGDDGEDDGEGQAPPLHHPPRRQQVRHACRRGTFSKRVALGEEDG